MTIGTNSSAPEADFAGTPVACGCGARCHHCRHRETRGGAQDGADIVRIGDLVEHQHDALGRQILERARAGDRPAPSARCAPHREEAARRSRPAHQLGLHRSATPSAASLRAAFSVA